MASPLVKFRSATLLRRSAAMSALRRIQMSNRIIDFQLSVIRERERERESSTFRRRASNNSLHTMQRSGGTQLALLSITGLSRISHLPFLCQFFSLLLTANSLSFRLSVLPLPFLLWHLSTISRPSLDHRLPLLVWLQYWLGGPQVRELWR